MSADAEKKKNREPFMMDSRDMYWKKELQKLLASEGFNKFSKRLEEFRFGIIDEKLFPKFTASMDFENRIIRVSSGFFHAKSNADTLIFKQLSVLVRHEMAHALLLHQIRMTTILTQKYKNTDIADRIHKSGSLFILFNSISDYEISNRVYTFRDKQTVRHMFLNGKVIGGLITEDQRDKWKTMNLEDMFIAMQKDIDDINKKIIDAWTADKKSPITTPKTHPSKNRGQEDVVDTIEANIISAGRYYKDINDQPYFMNGGLKSFFDGKAIWILPIIESDTPMGITAVNVTILKQSAKTWYNIAKTVYDDIQNSDKSFTRSEAMNILEQVARSGIMEVIDVVDPHTGTILVTLATPEEKFIFNDSLKVAIPKLEEEKTWQEKVESILKDYSLNDLQRIFNEVNNG